MSLKMERAVDAALEELTTTLAANEVIQYYQGLKRQVDRNVHLQQLQEEIKQAQQDAVHFARYGKPQAEKQAIQKADELSGELNRHPLVVAYRDSLAEANDLLSHLTKMIQETINNKLEEEQ